MLCWLRLWLSSLEVGRSGETRPYREMFALFAMELVFYEFRNCMAKRLNCCYESPIYKFLNHRTQSLNYAGKSQLARLSTILVAQEFDKMLSRRKFSISKACRWRSKVTFQSWHWVVHPDNNEIKTCLVQASRYNRASEASGVVYGLSGRYADGILV